MTFSVFRTFAVLFLVSSFLVFYPVSNAFAQNKKLTLPLEKDAVVMKWSFEGYGYGEMLIAVIIAPVEEKVAVCGVYSITKRVSAGVKRSQLLTKSRGRTSVWLNDVRILDGLRRLRRVEPDELAVGTPANCVLTNTDWHSSYSNEDVELRGPSFTSF